MEEDRQRGNAARASAEEAGLLGRSKQTDRAWTGNRQDAETMQQAASLPEPLPHIGVNAAICANDEARPDGLTHPAQSVITFFVPGIPQPGGSKKAFYIPKLGKAVVTEANTKSKPWRTSVEFKAAEIIKTPLSGPLEVHFIFYMPRPKGHFGSKGLRRSAPTYPTSRPDTTKLIRSTEDALNGIAWNDDSQIIRQVGEKHYGESPGCEITIQPLRIADLRLGDGRHKN